MLAGARTVVRSYAAEVSISRGGDGRTVEAYAAMFNDPYEVRDQHGHYLERIDPRAFDAVLRSKVAPMVLYNHGFTVHGTPDGLTSIPIGSPVEIRPDRRGLWTVSRYNRTALADAALEAIRAGDIRSQSFRGRLVRSSPERVPARRPGMPLPTVTRLELGLVDYGPTPMPVNAAAEIVTVRSRVHESPAERADRVRAEILRRARVAEVCGSAGARAGLTPQQRSRIRSILGEEYSR